MLAQTGNAAGDVPPPQISYAALPDSGYSLQQILASKNLPFIVGDSLRPYAANVYWLKIIITNPYHFAGQYSLEAYPDIFNTFYYFDANYQKWLTQTAGIGVPANKEQTVSLAQHLVMQSRATDTVYVKMDVSELKEFGLAIKPDIAFEEQVVTDRHIQNTWNGLLISLSVLCFFFLSNLYLYVSFRDRSVLFYLVAQVGGMIYITASRNFFPLKIFTVRLLANGGIRYFSVNSLLIHIGVLIVLYGFVQLTRAYLNTRKYLPRADSFLKYGLYGYLLLSFILIIVNSGFVYIENFTLIYDDIYVFIVILIIIITCVAGYRRRLRASGPFLLANILPLALMTAIALFQVFVSLDAHNDVWLPNLAVVSDAVVFSIALVARTKLIQNDLRGKELEAQQLGFELTEIGLRHSLAELENQKINADIQHEKTRNELLMQKLEANQRELASTTLYMVQKNELLATLKAQIAELNKIYPNNKQSGLSSISSILQSNLYLDDDWAKFKLHFEQVHPQFFDNLLAKHPSLTKNETRLYAYFHINLSTKEIATLLNIAPASVRQAKMRLYKKMGRAHMLGPDDNIDEV